MRGCGSPAGRRRPDVAAAGGVERRVLGEDRRLQPAQLGPRLEPELLAQEAATLLEDAEGVGLPAGAVQREHQQPAEALAQRMGGDELLELDDRPAGGDPAASSRSSRSSITARRSSDSRVIAADGEVLVGEVGQRIAPPERLGLGQQRRRRGSRSPAAASRPTLAATSCSNRSTSMASGGSSRAYPSPRMTTRSAEPSVRRSFDASPCRPLRTAAGGSSPHSASTSCSAGTTRPTCSARTARSARSFAPGDRDRVARRRRAPRAHRATRCACLTVSPVARSTSVGGQPRVSVPGARCAT